MGSGFNAVRRYNNNNNNMTRWQSGIQIYCNLLSGGGDTYNEKTMMTWNIMIIASHHEQCHHLKYRLLYLNRPPLMERHFAFVVVDDEVFSCFLTVSPSCYRYYAAAAAVGDDA